MKVFRDIKETLDPKKGGGMQETVLYVVLIVAVVYLKTQALDVPDEFYLGMGALLGYITRNNKTREDKENG